MVKLSIIRLYNTKDVPDYLLEEVNDVMQKMCTTMENICEKHDPNIILSAFNRFHASMICSMITKEGLIDAANTEAVGLVKNICHIGGLVKEEEL